MYRSMSLVLLDLGCGDRGRQASGEAEFPAFCFGEGAALVEHRIFQQRASAQRGFQIFLSRLRVAPNRKVPVQTASDLVMNSPRRSSFWLYAT
jgi:hypothetical protein